ncbi:MAG TPA: glycoside hydrolase [Candidatus Rokubacteria bacterium]|nr:MAG: hypothetical protein A2050_16060 [Candidatus Rokubacteria bacterium GWA2_73_35]HBH03870.1 glycoside hydrolase [Candidatus Rokubacteria bacterium]
MSRAVVVHGHFYQPPREHPWLEAVQVQDTAAPYHDWNERVTAECYAPNTAARRVDDAGRILDVVNNFEKISFDVGPTLFAWLARHRPELCAKIIEADWTSVRANGGHGNAIAQVYNHMIMPLATRRDKVTQVRWGIEDFRTRFGREPEGMWLPETAVDDETLEVLAEAGLSFTILAPHQARRVRPLGGDAWQEPGDGVDPRQAYRWRSPRGASLALFFYDHGISHGIAFGSLLERSEHLVAAIRGGFAADRDAPQLVHCATDGESYGHHRRFGEMALAAAIHLLETETPGTLTSYGAFLAAHPPAHEVEIHERTSWSCVHGVERWRADCGCRTRGDWQQRWRAPLREALDWLRDRIDPFFEARAAALLKDPWAARDAYVDVVLDRSPDRLAAFFEAQQRTPLDAAGRVEARRLLELERNRLLMYTSCGWFFDELSSLEPVQILRYAAMALRHLEDLGGERLEDALVERLAAAPSNVPEMRDGAEVWRRLVAPVAVGFERVIAHYAITDRVEGHPPDARVYAYRVERLDEARDTADDTTLRIARVRVSSEATGEVREAAFALVHYGGPDFACGIRAPAEPAGYAAMKTDLLGRFARFSVADLVRGLDEHFAGVTYSLEHLFLDERRGVLARVIAAVLERHEETYREIWEQNRKLMHYLQQVDAPIPDALMLAARHVLEQRIRTELEGMGTAIPARAFELADEAQALGLALDLMPVRFAMHRAVQQALAAVEASPESGRVAEAAALVAGAQRLGVRFGAWATQNRFFDLWRSRPDARAVLEPLAGALGFALQR